MVKKSAQIVSGNLASAKTPLCPFDYATELLSGVGGNANRPWAKYYVAKEASITTAKATKHTADLFLRVSCGKRPWEKGLKFNKNNKDKKATFAKASLVGATTVNGPGPERVSASPAASTKSTSWVAPEKKVDSG